MYSNVESPRRDFGDSLQLTNWILYSGATFHMTLEISDFFNRLTGGNGKMYGI